MPPKKLPKVSGKTLDYRKKKSKTTTSPYKFNEPKIKGKVLRPKPSALKSTRKSKYGAEKVKKVKKDKKEKKVKKVKKANTKKTPAKKEIYYEPPKIRVIRIVSTRSMVPMLGCV